MVGALRAVDDYVSAVQVDDSLVPYFQLSVGFIVVEYVWHTYLDIRQRQACRSCYFTRHLLVVTCALRGAQRRH